MKTGRNVPKDSYRYETRIKLIRARKSEKINDLLNGDWRKYGEEKEKWDESNAEYSLCLSLMFHGFTDDEINAIMLDESKIRPWAKDKEKTLKAARNAYLSNPNRFFSNKKFVPTRLSLEIQGEHRFLATSPNSDIWQYPKETGIWEPDGIQTIQNTATAKLKSTWKTHYGKETTNHIRICNYVKQDILGSPRDKLVCLNGVIDLTTKTLGEFDPELYAISGIPVKYDPTATCPTIDNFINEVVNPDDVNKIYEIAGYCLHKAYPIARFVIFHGERGSGGKSTLLKLLTALLGSKNVSSLNIQNLVDEGFRGSGLFRKLANISGDLPGKPITETGFLKKATGGDLITIEKKFKDPFDFYNYAKFVFSANQVPAPKYDDSGAFYRRTLLIPFPKHFADGEPGTDPNLIEKLTTPEELSGFLNKAIEHLGYLLERGKFYKEKSVDERKMSYMLESNQIQYFAVTYVSIDTNPDHYVTNEDLYRFYEYMCRQINKTPKASNVFSREIRRWVSYAYQGQTKIAKKSTKVWRGLTVDVNKLDWAYEVDNQPPEPEQPPDPQQKLAAETDTVDTDNTDVSPIKPNTSSNDNSINRLIPKTTVSSVSSVPQKHPNAGEKAKDQPIIDIARKHLKNNANKVTSQDLFICLKDNGYGFDELERLERYSLIFKFVNGKVELLGASK